MGNVQVEKALVPRSAATFQMFAALIDMQDRELSTQQAASLGTANGSNPDLQSEISRLTAELSNLRQVLSPIPFVWVFLQDLAFVVLGTFVDLQCSSSSSNFQRRQICLASPLSDCFVGFSYYIG